MSVLMRGRNFNDINDKKQSLVKTLGKASKMGSKQPQQALECVKRYNFKLTAI
jgi:hypothetical protein